MVTVRELIEALQKLPPDMAVVFGEWGGEVELDLERAFRLYKGVLVIADNEWGIGEHQQGHTSIDGVPWENYPSR